MSSFFSSPIGDFSSSHHDLQTIMKFNDISADVQQHLKLVYFALAMTALATAGGVFLGITLHLPPILGLVGSMGMMCWIYADQDKENVQKRMGLLLGFGGLQGLAIGPLISMAAMVDYTIIITALLCTMAIFSSFSLAAIISPRRSYLYLGGFLGAAMMMMCMMSLIGMFIPTMRFYAFHLYGGLIIFSGYVIYDTQIIIERAAQGSRDFAGHALTLFVDLIQIFVRIVMILLRNQKRDGGSGGGSLLPSSRGDL